MRNAHGRIYVGIDVSKDKLAIAIAGEERGDEALSLGTFENTPATVDKLLKKLVGRGDISACYEAGPTGYGLYRQIRTAGCNCCVVAPSLIPVRAGERVTTDRLDALRLPHILRAGELTPIWIPDETHEAMRDLVRARESAAEDQRHKRQLVSAFVLRHGRVYQRSKPWTMRYRRWLQTLGFDHPAPDRASGDAAGGTQCLGAARATDQAYRGFGAGLDPRASGECAPGAAGRCAEGRARGPGSRWGGQTRAPAHDRQPAGRAAAHRGGDRAREPGLLLRLRPPVQDRRGSLRTARHRSRGAARHRHHPSEIWPAAAAPTGDPGTGTCVSDSGRAADRGDVGARCWIRDAARRRPATSGHWPATTEPGAARPRRAWSTSTRLAARTRMPKHS